MRRTWVKTFLFEKTTVWLEPNWPWGKGKSLGNPGRRLGLGLPKANGWFWFWFGDGDDELLLFFLVVFFCFFSLPFKDIIKAFLQSFLFLFFSKQLWPVLSVCRREFKNSVFFIAVYKSLVVPVFFYLFFFITVSVWKRQTNVYVVSKWTLN